MCLSVTQAVLVNHQPSTPGGDPSRGPSSVFGKPGGGIEITMMGTKDLKLPVVLKVSLPLFLFLCLLLLIRFVLCLRLLPPPSPPPSVSFQYFVATWQSE
jgi:hypothetical protein